MSNQLHLQINLKQLEDFLDSMKQSLEKGDARAAFYNCRRDAEQNNDTSGGKVTNTSFSVLRSALMGNC